MFKFVFCILLLSTQSFADTVCVSLNPVKDQKVLKEFLSVSSKIANKSGKLGCVLPWGDKIDSGSATIASKHPENSGKTCETQRGIGK